jgi:hypothetical protein
LHPSINIIQVINLRRVRWVGHVACRGVEKWPREKRLGVDGRTISEERNFFRNEMSWCRQD